MYTKVSPHFEVLEIIAESPEFGLVLLCEWFGESTAPDERAVYTDAHGNSHTLNKLEVAEEGLYILHLPVQSLSTFGRAYRDVKAEFGDYLWVKE